MYEAGFPVGLFQEFSDALNNETFTVHLHEREPMGPMAGVMWMMLTTAAVFIGSNYFGGIFKEVGKDHYELLKKALANLTEKTMEIPRIEPVLIGTSGKVGKNDPFSMAFSVYANLPDGRTVKLLMPKRNDNVDYAETTNAFLNFMARCYSEGESVLAEAEFDFLRGDNPITVAYNPDTAKIMWMDPRPKPNEPR